MCNINEIQPNTQLNHAPRANAGYSDMSTNQHRLWIAALDLILSRVAS